METVNSTASSGDLYLLKSISLAFLSQNKTFTDVELVVENGSKKVYGHACVLAPCSVLIRSICGKRENQKNGIWVLEVPFGERVVSLLLQSLYSEKLSCKRVEIFEIIRLAMWLQLDLGFVNDVVLAVAERVAWAFEHVRMGLPINHLEKFVREEVGRAFDLVCGFYNSIPGVKCVGRNLVSLILILGKNLLRSSLDESKEWPPVDFGWLFLNFTDWESSAPLNWMSMLDYLVLDDSGFGQNKFGSDGEEDYEKKENVLAVLKKIVVRAGLSK